MMMNPTPTFNFSKFAADFHKKKPPVKRFVGATASKKFNNYSSSTTRKRRNTE